MRLLAVDPGSVVCGLAFFDGRDLIDLRVIRAHGSGWETRMASIKRDMNRLAFVSDWVPEIIATEDIAMARGPKSNPRTFAVMAQTRGALAMLFRELWPGARQLSVNPSRVRSVIGAPRGREAAKARNRWALETMSGWREQATQDECDAYIIGLAALDHLRAEEFGRMANLGSGRMRSG